MKITKEQLRRVIQEELENVMDEAGMPAKALDKLTKFTKDQYGGSKSKKSDKKQKKKVDEVSMDDLTDLNQPDDGRNLSGEKLTQEKLKNLFKAIQNLDSRISKLEPLISKSGRR